MFAERVLLPPSQRPLRQGSGSNQASQSKTECANSFVMVSAEPMSAALSGRQASAQNKEHGDEEKDGAEPQQQSREHRSRLDSQLPSGPSKAVAISSHRDTGRRAQVRVERRHAGISFARFALQGMEHDFLRLSR